MPAWEGSIRLLITESMSFERVDRDSNAMRFDSDNCDGEVEAVRGMTVTVTSRLGVLTGDCGGRIRETSALMGAGAVIGVVGLFGIRSLPTAAREGLPEDAAGITSILGRGFSSCTGARSDLRNAGRRVDAGR
jgi:hypothetical protein